MLDIKAGIHKMLVIIANWKDPDQSGTMYSIEWSLEAEFRSVVLEWSGVKFRSGKNSYYTCRFSLFDIYDKTSCSFYDKML